MHELIIDYVPTALPEPAAVRVIWADQTVPRAA